MFDSTTINARNGLRLPYSDKASMVVKDPEDREKIKRGEMSKNSAFKACAPSDTITDKNHKLKFEVSEKYAEPM